MSTRLQRRCLVTSAAVHGALGLLLVVAPAFRKSEVQALGNEGILEMIPGELIDEALAPGFLPAPEASAPPADASPPRANPKPAEPEPEPPSKPEPSKEPVAEKPAPSDISFELPKAREPGFTLPNAQLDEKNREKPKKPERESVKIDLTKIKTFKSTDSSTPDRKKVVSATPPGPSAEDLARQRRQDLLRTLDGASGRIAGAVSRGTVQIQTGPPGGGGGGGGGTGGGGSTYAWHVRNAFNNAWIAPQNVKDDLATVDVEIVIRKDGRILRASLVKRSGIAALDRSVQEAVDRVREIVPFESGATEAQRSYTIGFNLRAKRSF